MARDLRGLFSFTSVFSYFYLFIFFVSSVFYRFLPVTKPRVELGANSSLQNLDLKSFFVEVEKKKERGFLLMENLPLSVV